MQTEILQVRMSRDNLEVTANGYAAVGAALIICVLLVLMVGIGRSR